MLVGPAAQLSMQGKLPPPPKLPEKEKKPTPPKFDIFAAPDGNDLWMIQTNPNNIFQGNATKISH